MVERKINTLCLTHSNTLFEGPICVFLLFKQLCIIYIFSKNRMTKKRKEQQERGKYFYWVYVGRPVSPRFILEPHSSLVQFHPHPVTIPLLIFYLIKYV